MIDFVTSVKDPVLIPEEKVTAGTSVKREEALYNSALTYLCAKVGDSTVIHYYLNLYKYRRVNDMKDLYFKLLEHAKNRQGAPLDIDDIKQYKEILCDFDPVMVADKYSDWEEIFDAIKKVSLVIDEHDISRRRNCWILYAKTIFSAAHFLARFPALSEFMHYAQSFTHGNKDKRIVFALLLSHEINGFGFITACDFLKEWISPFFVKPDVHVKEIFIKTKFCSKKNTDFDICRKLIEFSDTVGQTPYAIERVFWLIGTGKLFKTGERKREVKINTSKTEFIEKYLNGVADR